MEIVSTSHPLRAIILRYDRSVTPPAFETQVLQQYREIHDRTQELRERVQKARRSIPAFLLQIEEIKELYREAQRKFDHLKIMYPTNPNRGVVRDQLKTFLTELSDRIDDLMDKMIGEVHIFFAHDDYIIEQDNWMYNTAFPEFSKIIQRHQEYSVDASSFDRDLEDFKHMLGYVKEQEGKYLDAMHDLVEDYSGLNHQIDTLYTAIEEFDPTLVEY